MIIGDQHETNKKTKTSPLGFLGFLLLFLSILIITITILLSWQQDNKKTEKLTKELEKIVKTTEKNNTGELINPPEEKTNDYWYYMSVPFLEVDFKELLKRNPDTVAFLHVENTNINYPVVQKDNNNYYLNHAFDQSRNGAGWVFLDYRNDINNLSDNTIIYGHGRLDNTVFGSLKKVLTNSWQQNKDNYVIQISTPKENMIFQIFSIYTIQEESYYITSTFYSEEQKQTWLDTMKTRNIAPIDTSVNTNDKILTLSTCENNEGGRIVVQAKLIRKESR